jgi:hypothetical protein
VTVNLRKSQSAKAEPALSSKKRNREQNSLSHPT